LTAGLLARLLISANLAAHAAVPGGGSRAPQLRPTEARRQQPPSICGRRRPGLGLRL